MPRTRGRPQAHRAIQARIIAQATTEFKLLDRDLRVTTLDVLRRTAESRHGEEIMLLPYLFYQSLKDRASLPEQLFVNLGCANLYGWMAYTIYDDLLDNEGDPHLLPAANVAMRRSLKAFDAALTGHEAFHICVRNTFDSIDAANSWEATRCRFAVREDSITIGTLPRYGRLRRLAERSLGHTLTPLAVLAASGITPESSTAQALQLSLRHYLIARQLNDDMHDLQNDLVAGRISYVLATALRELAVRPGTQKLRLLRPRVERQFWGQTLGQVCQTVTWHTKRSRIILQQYAILEPHNIILKLLDDIDVSVENTLASVAQAERFLHAYRK
jgi:hypothetical protein